MPPHDCDLIWTQGATIVDTYKVIRKANCPIITTIHGVNQFVLPIRYLTSNKREQCRWLIKKPLQYTFWQYGKNYISKFITVSQYSKQKLHEVYKINNDDIICIYHGLNDKIFNDEVVPYNHRVPYFLHVSNGKQIKNIDRIIQAFEFLNEKNIDLLVVAPLYERSKIKNKQIKFLDNQRYVSQAFLAKLYKGAMGFIFPSFDETFGFPILEAMACSCPVITSNISACAEIAGDAALLVNPYQIEEIADAMKKFINELLTRNSLIEKSRLHIQNFSWKKSAQDHYNLFLRVLDAGK